MSRRAPRSRLAAAVSLAAVLPACVPSEPVPEREPGRARAALASLTVDNRSSHRLTILYRLTARSGVVAVGEVRAGAIGEMAPVPAAEPLVLIARTPSGAELTLPPRTLPIGGNWTWTIPADAPFTPPPR